MGFLPPANEVCEGYVFLFTEVGGGADASGGLHPGGSAFMGSASRGSAYRVGVHLGDLHLAVCIQGGLADPTPSDTMGYGQQAGGTHPTGMRSCFNIR